MKTIFTHIRKSTLLAIAFFGLMTLVATASAQNDTLNPLVATTGPNVLPAGQVQWGTQFEAFNLYRPAGPDDDVFGKYNVTSLVGKTHLRIGLGSRTELTVGFEGQMSFGQFYDEYKLSDTNYAILPSIGGKICLFAGRGWLPQVAFHTLVEIPLQHGELYADGTNPAAIQPTIGFQFRNRLGKRWIIDYALGHTWNYYSARFRGAGRDLGLRYSLFVHWLATDRLLIGAGVNNDGADLSALIQATPNLQISLRGRYSMGYAMYNGYLHEIHALAGINWTI